MSNGENKTSSTEDIQLTIKSDKTTDENKSNSCCSCFRCCLCCIQLAARLKPTLLNEFKQWVEKQALPQVITTIQTTRDPSQTISKTAVALNGHVIDPTWATSNNLTTLELYFASLKHPTATNQDWLKQVFLTVAKSNGYVGNYSEFAVGLLLGLTPSSPYSNNPSADIQINKPINMRYVSSAVASIGMPINHTIRPWAALKHGENDTSDIDSNTSSDIDRDILWPLPSSVPPVSVTLPQDLLAAEKIYFKHTDPKLLDQLVTYNKESKEINAGLLPGLCFGRAGRMSIFSLREEFRNRYLSAVLNKLISNNDDRHCCDPKDVFIVTVNHHQCFSVSEFYETLGLHNVSGHIQSGLTVFGMHLHVKDVHTSHQAVPVARCVGTLTGIIDEQTGKELTTPVIHSGFTVAFTIGDGIKGHVQYYTGTEGFTGWHPDGEDYPYGNMLPKVDGLLKRKTNSKSGQMLPFEKLIQMTKCATALAVIVATCVEDHQMKCGGYAQIGVCNDSANILQHACGMKVTTASGSGNNIARQKLGRCARKFAIEAKEKLNGKEMNEKKEETNNKETKGKKMSFDVLNSVAKAIAAVKNDTSTSSSGDIKDLAFRILQSLPEDALVTLGEGGAWTKESLQKIAVGYVLE